MRAPINISRSHGTGGSTNASNSGFHDWMPSRMKRSFKQRAGE
jgi:hypothetical protein